MLFFIYINAIVDGVSSNTKLFDDDTSFFPIIHYSVITTSELTSDLARIKWWTFQWKISFNPDPNKKTQEVIISGKLRNVCHSPLRFNNNNNVSQASS